MRTVILGDVPGPLRHVAAQQNRLPDFGRMENLLKLVASIFLCLAATIAFGEKKVSTVSISPQGAVLQFGSNLQFSVACTYVDGSTDNCATAGGATWTAGAPSKMTVSGSGLATWTTDPGTGCTGECKAAAIVVSAGGVTDNAFVVGQHVGDQFYEYTTPDPNNYKDPFTFTPLPMTVAVGSQIAVGTGVVVNDNSTGNHTGVPFSRTCNWSSSDPTKATVNRHGIVTTLSPGNVSITCGRAGDGAFGTSKGANWTSPGNIVSFTVIPGGTGNTTWYVRERGGSIFVNATQTPAGQCDGKHDADYPGTGVNQPCALNNMRNLWADGVTKNNLQWQISGGDTVIVRQKSTAYNMNLDQASPYQTPAGKAWVPFNCAGDPFCSMPPIPSGTAGRHTRILGENYASCHADSAKTLLNVSYSGSTAFNLKQSQFVDVSCFEITDQAACSTSTNFTNVCHGSADNYGYNGITESALTSFVNYTDIFIHGLGGDGISGATGVGVVGNYIHIRGAPDAGINMDDNTWQSGNISVAGGFTLNNSITEFTGCVEEYPVVHNYPLIECRDQNLGGYADGFGTGSTTGDWKFDHDIWRYNFQDGLDLLHSGMQTLSVTNSQSYGNDGQSFKIGPADTVIFRNNFVLDNCGRIGQTIGDEPASAILPGVALCRAAGDWVPMQFSDLGSYTVQNNTLVGYGATVFDFGCSNGWDTCAQAQSTFQNNAVMGYIKTSYDGAQAPGLFYESSGAAAMPPTNGWAVRDHNFYYGVRYCPTAGPGEICNTVSPQFAGQPASPITSETALDNFSYVPASTSPLLGAGKAIAGLVSDILGNTRGKKPSIGAIDVSGGTSEPTTPEPQTATVSLSVTPTSTVAGANVTLSATASGSGSQEPTGTVLFLAGGKTIGSGTLSGAGTVSFSTTSFSAGTYTLSASYLGDSNFSATSSNQAVVTITDATALQPSFGLNVSPNPASPGQVISFTATLGSANGVMPSGNVTFSIAGKSVTAALNGSGVALTSVPSLGPGSYPITATYAGDTNFSSASASGGTLVVSAGSKASAAVGLSATPNPATTAQPVVLTATVPSVSGAVPTGTVNFTVNSKTMSAALNASGVASVSAPALGKAGAYTVTATYAGDTHFNSASAVPATINVAPPALSVAVSVAQPEEGFNVIPGSVRRVFAHVTNGSTNQVNWALKSGSAQIASSSGAWVDVTAGNSGSSCQLSSSASGVSSASQFTVEATSVDDPTKTADVTFNVCKPTVQVSIVPAYRTLYANQTADLQSLIVGSSNDGVRWSIASQPSGGDGKLVDSSARDTVFSATVAGRYTLSATSLADSGKSATSILYVTGHKLPYRVTPNQTEPVDCSVDPALAGTTYDVGPSQTYHSLKDVPLNSILNGSTIRLHNEDSTGSSPTTYNEYVQISQHAAPDQPIRICGVPDLAGNLPVVDGTNAVGRSEVSSFAAGNGILTVGGSTSGAAWPAYNGAQNIVVEGLHLRNAKAGLAYMTPSGSKGIWQSSAACVRIGDGHNISLIGNEMDGCATGASSQWNGTTWGGSSLNHLWEGNYIHGSGTSGSSANHQMYLQAWGQVVQFNRVDLITPGSTGANLKSRGIQDVIRYNYFGDGSARDLDLVDVGSAAQFMSFADFFTNNQQATSSTYSMDQLAAWQEAWNSHFAYGNIYLNSSSLAPVHFAYDQNAGEPARKGNLFWYNNTFYETTCSSCSGQLLTMFDTSGGNGTYLPQTEFQTVQAINNLIWMDNISQPSFQWNDFDAFIGVGAANLLPAGWGSNTLQGSTGDGWNATGNAAAYQNAASLPLHITGFSGSSVQTISTMPFDKVSWLLLNPASGTSSMPSDACTMPTRFSYLPLLGYAVPRVNNPNVGATDTASQTASIIDLLGGNGRGAIRSSNCK